MKIRSAKKNDYEQLLNLLRQLNPDDPEASFLERQAFDEIVDSKNLELIVAEDEGVLLSSCYLNVVPNITRGGRPYAIIENVITDSNYRNRGLGERVIKMALEKAWIANCYKVMLMSGRKDPAVHAFYQKCGFSADEKQAYVQRAL
ncbi:MAG: GNAT family N-acetyltransferase [Gammaproteobacteria bacterium]|nr:GNAT family N-acetyltransferase [Gammaproteobacteria bacterium]